MTSAPETENQNHHSARVARIGRWFGPLLFFIIWCLPTPEGLSPAGQRLLATTVLMGTYWLTSAMPIYVTSLVPLSLFPILGILSAKDVASAYISHTVFLYFGGFVVALGIERWGLHRRIALKILTSIGSSPQRVVLGFMWATGFLSMWISNTATTLLMLPIALSLTGSLREVSDHSERSHATLETALLLGIAYSASIGGMLTLVGTPTNVAFAEIFERNFPEAPEISMGAWITAFLPMGLLFLHITWWKLCRPIEKSTPVEKHFFRDRLTALGPPSQGELWMLLLFITTAALWMFRSDLDFGLGFTIPGWKHIAAKWLVQGLSLGAGDAPLSMEEAVGFMNDSTVAMTMCLAMFLIPAKTGTQESSRSVPLMDWETMNNMPWGILLLFGGGFALADAFTSTGLSSWIGIATSELLGSQPLWVLVAGVCFTLTFLTEFTTNVATVAALMPVLAALSINLGIDPRLIMIPATLSTSCAFMLPIATPPNAIVFGSGRLRTQEMARHGVVLNLIGVVLITTVTFTWALPVLGIDTSAGQPAWAESLAPLE